MKIKNLLYLSGLVSILHYPVFAMDQTNNAIPNPVFAMNQINDTIPMNLEFFTRFEGGRQAGYVTLPGEGNYRVRRDRINGQDHFYINFKDNKIYTNKVPGSQYVTISMNDNDSNTHYFSSGNAFLAFKKRILEEQNLPKALITEGLFLVKPYGNNGSQYISYKGQKIFVACQNNMWYMPWDNLGNFYFKSAERMLEYKKCLIAKTQYIEDLKTLKALYTTKANDLNSLNKSGLFDFNSLALQQYPDLQQNVFINKKIKQDNHTNASKIQITTFDNAFKNHDPRLYSQYPVTLYKLPASEIRKNQTNMPLEQIQQSVNVVVENRPFAAGSMRHAYRAQVYFENATHPRRMVMKSGQKVNHISIHYRDLMTQTIAKELCDQFNNTYQDIIIEKLDFPIPYIGYTTTGNAFFLEEFIPGNHEKHNNNYGFVNPTRNTPQAFSHFSYAATGGIMMVVDLQGAHNRLNDPQIHHISDSKNYGEGNLGINGMKEFFKTHLCNDICKAIGIYYDKSNLVNGLPPKTALNNYNQANAMRFKILSENPCVIMKKINNINMLINNIDHKIQTIEKNDRLSFNS